MIHIVNYEIGNLGSIANMLRTLGIENRITSDPAEVLTAERLILPGVGAFARGIENLRRLGFIEPLRKQVLEKRVPILGICVGMQLFATRSEEGDVEGLGWIDAPVVRFTAKSEAKVLKVPHMGWNSLSVVKNDPLFADMDEEARFYFVHSYHFAPSSASLATCHYGSDFPAAVRKDNIVGVQFHPEKSLRFGMKIFQNFAKMDRCFPA